MKKILSFCCIFGVLVFLNFSCKKESDTLIPKLLSSGTWTEKQSFPGPERTAATSFVVNGKAYITGGTTDFSTFFKDVWQYNPADDTWTKKNDMPVSRAGAVSFVINNKAYITTGNNDNIALSDLWEYNPANDVWVQKTGLPGGFARSNATGFSINGKGYIATGGVKDFWEYSPASDTWTKKTDPPFDDSTGVTGVASFVYGNKAYLVGGQKFGGDGVSKFLWEYNSVNDSWLQKQSLPDGNERSWAECFVINNRVFFTGGGRVVNDNFVTFTDVWEYDVKNNKWIERSSLPAGKNRMDHCSFVISNKAYIVAGVKIVSPSANFKDVWEFKL